MNDLRSAFLRSGIGRFVSSSETNDTIPSALKNSLKIVSVRHGVDVSSLLNIVDHDDKWLDWCRNVSMTTDFDDSTIVALEAKQNEILSAIDRITDDLDPEGYRFDKTGRPAWISNLQAGLKACKLIW